MRLLAQLLLTTALFSCTSKKDNRDLVIGNWKATTATTRFGETQLPTMEVKNFYCTFTRDQFIEYTLIDGKPDTSKISTYKIDLDSIYVADHSVGPGQNFGYSFEENKPDVLILKNKVSDQVELKTTYKRIDQ